MLTLGINNKEECEEGQGLRGDQWGQILCRLPDLWRWPGVGAEVSVCSQTSKGDPMLELKYGVYSLTSKVNWSWSQVWERFPISNGELELGAKHRQVP